MHLCVDCETAMRGTKSLTMAQRDHLISGLISTIDSGIMLGHRSMTYDLPNKAKKMLPKRLKTSFHGIFTLLQPTVNKTEW